MYFLEPGIVLSVILLGYIYYLWQTKSKDWKVLLNAAVVSVIWFLLAYKMYQYNSKISFKILSLPIFPLVAWIVGLITFYYLSQTVIKTFPKFFKNTKREIIFSLIFYSALIIIVESIGYNILGMKLTSNYPGLKFCNCLHAPLWMQTAYFLNGYTFIFLNKNNRLENWLKKFLSFNID